MPVLRITGIPKESTDQKQLKILRIYLRKCDVENFWINEVSDTRGTDLKEAGIEVTTDEEAYMVESFLSKVPYRKNGIPYVLKAELVNYGHENNRRSRSRSPHSFRNEGKYSSYVDRYETHDPYLPRKSRKRFRSPSPYEVEKSKLDVEIEILRKKRQLVEEERKLLGEKTKLEMMWEYGASASREIDVFERNQRSRDREMRPKRQRSRPPPPAICEVSLPLFVMPCKAILRKLKPFIVKAKLMERPLVIKVIRSHLRRTFALLLADRGYLPTSAIVDLYREVHPPEGDEKLVTKIVDNVRASFWPIRQKPEKPQPQKKKNNDKNNPGRTSATPGVQKNPEKILEPVTIKEELDVKPDIGNLECSDIVDSIMDQLVEVDNIEPTCAVKIESVDTENVESENVPSQVESNDVADEVHTANIHAEQVTNLADNVVSTDVAKDQSTDVAKDQSTDVAKGQFTDVAKYQSTDVAKDQSTGVAKDQSTSVAKGQFTDVAKDQSTDVAKEQSTDVAKEQSTVVAKEQSSDVVKDQFTDVPKDQSTHVAAKESTKVDKQKEHGGSNVVHQSEAADVVDHGEFAEAADPAGSSEDLQDMTDEDDWITNGIDWDDDDDDEDSKDEQEDVSKRE